MKKKTAQILLSVILLVLTGALIAQMIVEKENRAQNAVRGLLSIATCASALVMLCTGARSARVKTAVYEEKYRDILKSAFQGRGQKRSYRKLMSAIGDYNCDRLPSAIKKLDHLLPRCDSRDDSCAVLMFLALSYTDQNRTQAAMDAYRELLKYDQTRSTAWSNLGLLLKKQGKNTDAVECYTEALKYDAANPYARQNLAAAYYEVGDYHAAVEHASVALELKSNLRQASDVLCLSYFALQDLENSRKYFQISVSNGSDSEQLQALLKDLKKGQHIAEDPFSVPENQNVCLALTEFYQTTAIPFVHIAPDPDSGKHSRIGGGWNGETPTDSLGKPMRLLCAIDCAEVRGVPDFPNSGMLCFFIADNDVYGADFEHPNLQRDFRVLYTEKAPGDSDAGVAGTEQTAEDSAFPILQALPVELIPDIAAMTDDDYRFRPTLDGLLLKREGTPVCDDMPDDLFDEICELHHSEGSRIGGYPHFTQYDPREDNEDYRRYDVLLLQLDSDAGGENSPIMIGDCGVMNFFIPSEKLKKRDFSDILYWWDCT